MRVCSWRTSAERTCINKSLFQALKSSPVVLLGSHRRQLSGNLSHTIFLKVYGNVQYISYMVSIDILLSYKLDAFLHSLLSVFSLSITPLAVLPTIVPSLVEFNVNWLEKNLQTSNDGWIRYVRAIQRWLLDAGRSTTQPLSSSVSDGKELYNTNNPSSSSVTVVRITCACTVYSCCSYRIRGEGGGVSSWRNTVFHKCSTLAFLRLLLLLQLLLSTKNLTSRNWRPGTPCILLDKNTFESITAHDQEFQFLKFMGGSNSTHAHSNHLICMHFIWITTVYHDIYPTAPLYPR